MKRTVFVVGAGASTDFGFQLGSELAAHLRGRLQGELTNIVDPRPIMDAAMNSGLPGDYGAAAQDLAGGLISARSIDRLLDSRKDRELVLELGKCGIVTLLAEQERRSRIGNELNVEDWHSRQAGLLFVGDSWLARLFSQLQEGIPPSETKRIFENCSFVTFNYDRCIERYLQLAMVQVMNIDFGTASAIVAQIPIVHVYGSLGDSSIPYGPPEDILRHSVSSIRTFTEGAVDGTLAEAQDLVGNAEVIVSLGFAFDPVNVTALFRDKLLPAQKLLATSLGMADIDKAVVMRRLLSSRDQITFSPLDCKTLINHEMLRTHLFS